MKNEKPYVIYIENETKISMKKNIFVGHIVHCKDLDSQQEFHVEIFLNQNLSEDRIEEVYKGSASKNPMCDMFDAESMEFEYVGPSGRVREAEDYNFRTELSPITEESQALLDNIVIE